MNKQYNESELQLWDLGGKESLKKLWESYYDDVEGIIYMLDLNSNFIENSLEFLSKIFFKNNIDL